MYIIIIHGYRISALYMYGTLNYNTAQFSLTQYYNTKAQT